MELHFKSVDVSHYHNLKKLLTALVTLRVAHLFTLQSVIRKQCSTFSPGQQMQAEACTQRRVLSCSAQSLLCEGSGSVTATRVYLGSMIGHLSHMAPSAGATTTITTHGSLRGKEKEGGTGVSLSEASKTLVERFMKLSTDDQKTGLRKFDRGVADVWKASPSRFFPALWIH